ncbi:MAG: phosphate signaling complex protein PhoU [bacterium]|nr:phosphate signaling complex protein PhoU [bacterium]
MGHYEERLNADLEKIRSQLAKMGRSVCSALENATRVVLTRDADLAAETILGDLPINRHYRKLDHRCHVFVARHLPSAGHLRLVSAVMRLSKTLERIGDYAETISRAALQLQKRPPEKIAQDIELMSERSLQILAKSLEAFNASDEELARSTLSMASRYGSTFDQVFGHLAAEGESGSRKITDLFSLMAVFNRFERVIHQAKNICEQTIFVVTGETKDEKTFDILFVDSRNAGASQLAEHFARKAYPGGGSYQSAGWDPGEVIDPEYLEFAEQKGFYLGDARLRRFDTVADDLQDFDIIIDLTGKAREHIPKVPFHTTLLSWPIEDRKDPEVVYKQLAPRLDELMSRLRGEGDD